MLTNFFYLRCEWDLKPKISKNKIKSFFNQLNYLAPTLLSHQYIQMVVAQKITLISIKNHSYI